MRKLVEAMPKAAMHPARTPTHSRPRCTRPAAACPLINIAAGMVPSASPRWLRLTGRVANCLFSASLWPTKAAERHHDGRVRTAERRGERVARARCAWRGADGGLQKCVYEPTS